MPAYQILLVYLSETVGIFSAKGGVGKTTLVANLGASITNVFKKNVLIFDTNLKTSHLGLHFGVYDDLPVTLKEVLKQNAPILHAVYTEPRTGVRLVPAPLNSDGAVIDKKRLSRLLNKVKDNYEIVIVDTSPGLGFEFICAAESIDRAIVVTTPEITSVTDAMKTVEILKKLRKNIFGIVVNRVRNQKYELTLKEIESTIGENVIAVVHEDNHVPESISKGVPVTISYPNSRVSNDINKLAGMLIGREYVGDGMFGMFSKFFEIFKLNGKRDEFFVEDEKISQRKQTKGDLIKEVEVAEGMRKDLLNEVEDEIKDEIKQRVKKRLMERMRNG